MKLKCRFIDFVCQGINEVNLKLHFIASIP